MIDRRQRRRPTGAAPPHSAVPHSAVRAGAFVLAALSGLVATAAFAQSGDSGASAQFASDVLEKGLLFTYGLAFVKGLGAVFNPCVYPLIPITLSLIGARGQVSRRQAVRNASLYVLGMAIMYTSLGLLAAGLGKIAGFTFQNAWLMGFVVLVFVMMALSMFGAFELRLPAQWTDSLTNGRGQAAKVILMGLFSGIVAAPCTAPFVFSLLAYVSNSQDMVLGGSTLFVFSLGLGLPFLLLGVFSGAVSRMPRNGPWLVGMKYLFGLVMLAMAAYYLPYVVGDVIAPVLAGAAFVLLGITAVRNAAAYDWTDRAYRFGGALVLVLGLGLYSVGLAGASRSLLAPLQRSGEVGEIAWLRTEPEAIAQGKTQGKPVMLDFWATWCKACKELDAEVLRRPEVVTAARGFVSAKIDCTKETPAVKALYRRYGIQGLPALIFVSASGAIRHDLTVTEPVPAADFVERMGKAQQ